jgi:cell division protein FtsA
VTGAGHGVHVVGLDVGTARVVALVAAVAGDRLHVIGLGTADSEGIRRGSVTDLHAAAASIRRAVAEAELTAGLAIHGVHLGMSGAHVSGVNSRGVVTTAGRAIDRADVVRAVTAATPLMLSGGREILHVVPQHFTVDERDGIGDPCGMTGTRLEASVHVIAGHASSARDLAACASRAGLAPFDVVVSQLAVAESVLTADEKELGVAVVDIGAGMTGMALYERGVPWHTAAIDLGGDHLTADVAIGLRTPTRDAERLKCRSGCALTSLVDAMEEIVVPSLGDRPPRVLPRRVLATILQARSEELLRGVAREIAAAGFEHRLTAGVVLCGGGALLPGFTELAELSLGTTVRCAAPDVGGLGDHVASPSFAAAVGLARYASRFRFPSICALLPR